MTTDDDKPVSPHAQTVDATDAQDPLIGKTLGHYRIVGRLGAGGMGVVYRADDEKLRRAVALKVLPETSGNEKRRQRFLREARSAAAITHPNVAVVYAVDEAQGRIYIAMELVEGENLAERLVRGRLDLATAKDFATQIARGLAAAHEKNLLHRDLKPPNVMITPAGQVKILDFGLAKPGVVPASAKTEAALAKTETVVTSEEGRIMGTPEYMSPEQALGEPLDVRSDVFSLGIVMYEMLSGVRPFAGASTGAVLVAIARDVPRPLRDRAPEVDEPTEAVVLRCLAKAPGERFANAGQVVKALSEQTSPKATTEPRSDVQPGTQSGTVRRRPKAVVVVGALLAIAFVGAGAWSGIAHRSKVPVSATSASATANAGPSASASPESLPRSSNPEAQRLFEEAMRSYHDGTGQTVPLLERAVKADPGFGGAYLRLLKLSTPGEAEAREYRQRIIALEPAMPARDRAFFDWMENRSDDTRLDAYLARYPDDDFALVAKAEERGDPSSPDANLDASLAATDRALAAAPTLVPLLVIKAHLLEEFRLRRGATRDEEATQVLSRCLESSPHATACLSERAHLLDWKGDCAGAEADVRQWLELLPDAHFPRSMLAAILAAQGAPIDAVREALGEDARAVDEHRMVMFAALIPMLEGDFVEVERLAATTRVPSSGTEWEHFAPAATLVTALSETGDSKSAGRVAAEYLSRRAGWREPSRGLVGFFVGAAARGGTLDPSEASRRLDAAYESMSGFGLSNAWAMSYGAAAATRPEALTAVAKFDTARLAEPSYDWEYAYPRVFFLAGRGNDVRPLIERLVTPCSSVLLDTPNWVRWHLYLGELDEQAGDKPSACNHYSKVLERWGHAKPHSVTADEARAHATKLGCAL